MLGKVWQARAAKNLPKEASVRARLFRQGPSNGKSSQQLCLKGLRGKKALQKTSPPILNRFQRFCLKSFSGKKGLENQAHQSENDFNGFANKGLLGKAALQIEPHESERVSKVPDGQSHMLALRFFASSLACPQSEDRIADRGLGPFRPRVLATADCLILTSTRLPPKDKTPQTTT